MSLIWDVASVSVDGNPAVPVQLSAATVVIEAVVPVTQIELTVPNVTETVTVEVPGIQGPPGLQNVFIQETSPAIQYGWGPEDAGKIWIPT